MCAFPCHLQVELGTPDALYPGCGRMEFLVDFSPCGSPDFEVWEVQAVHQFLPTNVRLISQAGIMRQVHTVVFGSIQGREGEDKGGEMAQVLARIWKLSPGGKGRLIELCYAFLMITADNSWAFTRAGSSIIAQELDGENDRP